MAILSDTSLLAVSNISENNKTQMVQLLWSIDGHFMPCVIVANLKVKQMLRSKSDLAANDL